MNPSDAMSAHTGATRSRGTDSLGCAASALHEDRELSTDGIRFHRKIASAARPGAVSTPATGRGFLVGISMGERHQRKIIHEHHAVSHDFGRGSIYIRDFSERYRAEMQSPFDFVLLEISPWLIERTNDERTGNPVTGLKRVTAHHDQTLAHLAMAMAPALKRPDEASALFVDQMGVVFSTYLMERYGGAAPDTRKARRVLSRVHETRAKDLLRSRLDGEVSISEIAQACGLSRSYFIAAFRQTTGKTPHQWLLAERVARARTMLADANVPLTEIAAACGFADQSHLTRVFTRLMGAPPGQWRRAFLGG